MPAWSGCGDTGEEVSLSSVQGKHRRVELPPPAERVGFNHFNIGRQRYIYAQQDGRTAAPQQAGSTGGQ